MSDVIEIPFFPMERAHRCPFDPAPRLREIQQGPKVSQVRLWDGTVAWLVADYELGRQVLQDARFSSDPTKAGFPHMSNMTAAGAKGGEPLSFVHMDEPRHRELRRPLNREFMIRRVESLRPQLQVIVDGLIDNMLDLPRPVDLVEVLALPVPSAAISILLGVPYAEHAQFQRWSYVMSCGTSTDADIVEARQDLKRYLRDLIKQKMHSPADDLLSRLVVDRDPTQMLTLDEATEIAELLLFAGHETTANQIGIGVLALLEHPDQLAVLLTDGSPEQVSSAVEELLRYAGIGHMGRRRLALEALELAGQQIAAGEGVIVAGDVANRDAEAFPEPDRLDVRREARHHVAFGYGAHQCLGQSLARMELAVVLSSLLRRLPNLQLAAPIEDLPFKDGHLNYGVLALPVVW